MTLTTTINLINKHRACVAAAADTGFVSGWSLACISERFASLLFLIGLAPDANPEHLDSILGGLTSVQCNEPINLTVILNANGLGDCLWVMTVATQEDVSPVWVEYYRAIAPAQVKYEQARAVALANHKGIDTWDEYKQALAMAKVEYTRGKTTALAAILQ